MWSSPSHGHSVDTQGKGDWEKKHSDKSLLLASLLLLVTLLASDSLLLLPTELGPQEKSRMGVGL